jgi:hypothetical protein
MNSVTTLMTSHNTEGTVPIHVTDDVAKTCKIRAASSKPSTAYVFRAAAEGVFGQIFRHYPSFRTARMEANAKVRRSSICMSAPHPLAATVCADESKGKGTALLC